MVPYKWLSLLGASHHLNPDLGISDVVETVTFETETWLNFRDRDRDFIKNSETETRDLTSNIKSQSTLRKCQELPGVILCLFCCVG